MTIQHLLDHGYKEYKIPDDHYRKRLFEKRMEGYCIHVTVYEWPGGWTHFAPQVQFRTSGDRAVTIELTQWYNTRTGNEDHDITEAERHFAEIYERMGYTQ